MISIPVSFKKNTLLLMLRKTLNLTSTARLRCKQLYQNVQTNCWKIFFLPVTIFMLLCISALSFAQTKSKKVLGTFVYKDKAYNYELKKADVNNYSFTINSLTKTSDNVDKFDNKKATDTTNVKPVDTTKVSIITDPKDIPASVMDADTMKTDSGKNVRTFDEFNRDGFIKIFKDVMIDNYSFTNADTISLNKKALELFFVIQAKLEFLDDEPVTAHLILKRDTIKSILISNSSGYYNGRLSNPILSHKVTEAQVETEDGTIKNIIVRVTDPSKGASLRGTLEFKNLYPISISGKHDPERFAKIRLYCFNCNGILGLNRFILFGDLLELDITLDNDKEDYSPANTKFTLSPQLPIVEMKKEKRSQLITVSAFSDFVGLDQEQPNGLLQIEAKRKININTKYHPVSSFWGIFKQNTENSDNEISKYDLDKYDVKKVDSGDFDLPFTRSARKKNDTRRISNDDSTRYQLIRKKYWVINNIRFFNEQNKNIYLNSHPNSKVYLIPESVISEFSKKNSDYKSGYYAWSASIEPKLLFSKLDGNNKFLILDSTHIAIKRVNPLKQFQYQLASFGVTWNILKIVYPQAKLNWNVLDVGAFWYRSRVQSVKDTATQNSIAINNGYASASSLVNFKPDNRWGASIGLTYIFQKAFNNVYKFERNNGLAQANFDAFIKTNDESKMFFRFRWTLDGHTFNNNFTQVQIGYTINIFSSSGSSGK